MAEATSSDARSEAKGYDENRATTTSSSSYSSETSSNSVAAKRRDRRNAVHKRKFGVPKDRTPGKSPNKLGDPTVQPPRPATNVARSLDRIFQPPPEIYDRVFKAPTPTESEFSDPQGPLPKAISKLPAIEAQGHKMRRSLRRKRSRMNRLEETQEWNYASHRSTGPARQYTYAKGIPPPWSCQLMAGRTASQPCPLLYIRVHIGDKRCWALLDSGAADNFISTATVKAAGLSTQPLSMPWAVSLGNGDIVYTDQYTVTDLKLDDYKAQTCFKVLNTDLAMVLGYSFLLKHRPHIDWRQRTLRFSRNGKEYLIRGQPGSRIAKEELNRVELVSHEALEEWTRGEKRIHRQKQNLLRTYVAKKRTRAWLNMGQTRKTLKPLSR